MFLWLGFYFLEHPKAFKGFQRHFKGIWTLGTTELNTFEHQEKMQLK